MFTIALGVVFGLLVIEVVLLLLGGALPDVEMDADGDLDGPVLDFLHVGRIPLVAVLALFGTGFGLAGLAVQGAVGTPLAVVIALVVALATVRFGGAGLARVFPREESSAMTRDELIGHTAVVVLGEGRRGAPTQAKFTDRHGQTHYVLVQPAGDEPLKAGETIVLVACSGAVYDAIGDGPDALERYETAL